MRRRINTPTLRLLVLHLTGLLAVLVGLGTSVAQPAPLLSLPAAAAALPPTPVVRAVAPPAPKPTPVRTRQVLVVLGDSVPAATACNCAGFATDLARSVQPALLTNAAEGGMTSAGLLAQLSSPAVMRALSQATVVTVTVGANDFDDELADDPSCVSTPCYAPTLRSLSTTMGQVATRLNALTRPTTKIILTGYWNVFLDGAVGARHGRNYVATSDALTRQVNAVIAAVAAAGHDHYADLYSPFKGDGSRDDTALLAADGDHPDAAGHQLIAAVIASSAGLSTLQ